MSFEGLNHNRRPCIWWENQPRSQLITQTKPILQTRPHLSSSAGGEALTPATCDNCLRIVPRINVFSLKLKSLSYTHMKLATLRVPLFPSRVKGINLEGDQFSDRGSTEYSRVSCHGKSSLRLVTTTITIYSLLHTPDILLVVCGEY